MKRVLPLIFVLALAGCGDNETAPGGASGLAGDAGDGQAGDGAGDGADAGSQTQTQPLCVGAPYEGQLTGVIDVDSVLLAQESPYDLQGRLQIGEGATLCVAPGVTVRMGAGALIQVGADSGALIARGTRERPIVFTSAQATPRPGDWDALVFLDGNQGDVTHLEHVIVEYAGSPAISIGATDVTIERTTIRHSAGAAVQILAGGAPARLTELTFEDNGAPSLSLDAARWGDVGGGHRFGAQDCIQVNGGTIEADVTVTAATVPFCVTGDITVDGGDAPSLTLQAGVRAKFAAGVVLTAGTLNAQGTEDKPVSLTAWSDHARAGGWGGVSLTASDDPSELSHTYIDYGGSQGAALLVAGQRPALTDVTIRYSSDLGIHFADAAAGASRFSDNRFEGIAEASIRIKAGRAGDLDEPFEPDGPTDVVEVTGGRIVQDATWPGLAVPWRLLGTVSVTNEARWTIPAGTTIQAASVSSIVIGEIGGDAGALIARGQPGQPIRIAPILGGLGWGGLQFANTSAGSALEHVEIQDARGTGCVVIDRGRPVLRSTTLSGCAGSAIAARGPQAGFSAFEDNRLLAPAGPAVTIDAARSGDVRGEHEITGDSPFILVTGDSITADTTWANLGVPWVIGSQSLIAVGAAEGAALTVEAGVTVRFDAGAGLYVGHPDTGPGDLVLLGTPEAPVRFTPASTEPEGGMWRGIAIDGGARRDVTRLEDFVVEFGGQGIDVDGLRHANLILKDNDVDVRNAEVRGSTGFGIEITGGAPTLSDITYEGNEMGDWVRWN